MENHMNLTFEGFVSKPIVNLPIVWSFPMLEEEGSCITHKGIILMVW